MEAAEAGWVAQGATLSEPSSTWRAALAGALVGALLAGFALAAMPAARGLLGAAAGLDTLAGRQQLVSSAQEWPRRPLHREWRWSPRGVGVDHMFRQPR
jgi:hypothetical protein